MNALILVASTLVGIDVGWQPLEDGGYEYLIQIPPHLVDRLKAGEPIRSDLPPGLRDIRSWTITVGTAALPRIGNFDRPPPAEQLPLQLGPPPAMSDGGPDAPHRNPPPTEENPRGSAAFAPIQSPPAEDRTAQNPAGRPDPFSLRRGNEAGSETPHVPKTFQAPPDTLPIASQANFETEGRPATDRAGMQSELFNRNINETQKPQLSEADVPPKPWLPLTLTTFGLFASLAGNAYLGWLALGFRQRCKSLMQRRFPSNSKHARRGPIGRHASHGFDKFPEGHSEEDEDQEVRAVEDDDAL